jgi:hypothetical protein
MFSGFHGNWWAVVGLLWFLCHVADVSSDILKECTVSIFWYTSMLYLGRSKCVSYMAKMEEIWPITAIPHISNWPDFLHLSPNNWHNCFFPTTLAPRWTRFSNPEDGGSTFLQNITTHIYHTTYKPKRRPNASISFSSLFLPLDPVVKQEGYDVQYLIHERHYNVKKSKCSFIYVHW